MVILLAPSERKNHGGSVENDGYFWRALPFGDALEPVLRGYVSFLHRASSEKKANALGVRELKEHELELARNIFKTSLAPAIERYSGVAFAALNFSAKSKQAQDYLLKNVLIFSNLFGLLRASDLIPYYELKQGRGFRDFETAAFYRANRGAILGELGRAEWILDLRAGFYQRCFSARESGLQVVVPVFYKGGKIVSHYAKFYRGALLASAAEAEITSIDELNCLYIDGLRLLDSTRAKDGTLLLNYQVL